MAPSPLSTGICSNFYRRETSTFCLYFSLCWRCSANEGLQSALPFLHKKKLLLFTAIVTKIRFVDSNSQVYCNKLQNILSADFKLVTFSQRSKLPWSQNHNHVFILCSKTCQHHSLNLQKEGRMTVLTPLRTPMHFQSWLKARAFLKAQFQTLCCI